MIWIILKLDQDIVKLSMVSKFPYVHLKFLELESKHPK